MQKKTGMSMMLLFATTAFALLAGVITAAFSEGAALSAAGVTGANGDEVNIVLIFAVIIIVVVVLSLLWWLWGGRRKKSK
jgi:membrane protein DedA with SNARE-associated domain